MPVDIDNQEGVFYHGTFGYPIEVTVGVSLADVTAVKLRLVKPGPLNAFGVDLGGGAVIDRTLNNSVIVDAVTGKVRFSPLDGELDTPGTYTWVLEFDTGSTRRLLVDGSFFVD